MGTDISNVKKKVLIPPIFFQVLPFQCSLKRLLNGGAGEGRRNHVTPTSCFHKEQITPNILLSTSDHREIACAHSSPYLSLLYD